MMKLNASNARRKAYEGYSKSYEERYAVGLKRLIIIIVFF